MTNFKTSSIHILVALEKATLQQVIDAQLPVELLEQFSPDGDKDMRISVKRKGKVDIQASQNKFNYQVPLELLVQKDTLFKNVEVLFEMSLNFETKFLFKEDWELATRTQLIDYQWIKKPELDLGIINIPLNKIVAKALNENKQTVEKQVDEKLKEVLDLRTMLHQGLAALPNPIVTPAGAEVWWQCPTIETALSPLEEKDGFIYAKLGLKGPTEFSYGAALEKINTDVKSPDMVADLPPESLLQTVIRLDFKTVEKTALALLQEQSFDFKNRKVRVTSVQVSQFGERLKLTVSLDGSFNGSMTLIGKPVFDNAKQQISLTGVDLELKGNNFLSKTLVVFLRKIVEDKITEFLNFPITKSLEFANKEINHVSFDGGYFVKAKINAVDLPQIVVEQNALMLNLSVQGVLQLGLENTIPVA